MISEAKRLALFIICKIFFLNKGVELINLSRIFHDPSAEACFPANIKYEDPAVIYSLTNPSKSKMFDFNKFISKC